MPERLASRLHAPPPPWFGVAVLGCANPAVTVEALPMMVGGIEEGEVCPSSSAPGKLASAFQVWQWRIAAVPQLAWRPLSWCSINSSSG